MKYSPRSMQEKLTDKDFGFKKKFGQNFIIDENIINSILNKSEVDEKCMVIEIGPGAGSLTYKLGLKSKNVLCYEIDSSLDAILGDNLRELDNIEIKFEDFLKADVKNDLAKYEFDKLYVIANLPYYITTPIIVKIIEDELPVDKIVIMVQKEVGDRLKAKPGTKEYGSLTVYINYYFNVIKLLDVSRNVFMPKPNVDSIVVCLNKKEKLIELKDSKVFFKLVRDSFTQKRKTLRNNLRDYDLETINNVLEQHNLDLTVRAEQLSLETFAAIANKLN